ncbi:hypothetical protein FCV25MIE_14464 [Fagus crenata]
MKRRGRVGVGGSAIVSDLISSWVEARDTHDGHCRESTSERRFVHGDFLWERAAWSWEVFVVEWVHVRRGMEERESEWEREAFMAIWSDLRRRFQVWENGWMVLLIRGLGYQIESMGLVRSIMLMGMCIKDSGKRNLQDGEGRYTWSNGNEYVGEWKSGVISRKGVFVLANGDKYDMSWENGVPKWEREGCAGLSCAVGLLPPVSVSAKGVKREREGLCSSVR